MVRKLLYNRLFAFFLFMMLIGFLIGYNYSMVTIRASKTTPVRFVEDIKDGDITAGEALAGEEQSRDNYEENN